MRVWLVRGGMAAAIVLGSSLWAVPASAGGGCHRENATDGTGDTVAMSKACFDPGVLRIDPGAQVTFVNQDPLAHNVSATGWGYYGEMLEGDTYRATFDEPGVYPFACTYHPGMTGAIVVGTGLGAGSGVTDGPVGAVAAGSEDGTAPAATVEAAGNPVVGWALGGAGGFAVGAAAASLLRRRRTAAERRAREG